MKIVTIVGARPQFIKAAAVSRAIAMHNAANDDCRSAIKEIIVHTGQHFDENMSEVFFREMDIPRPDYNLEINSLSHGAMTGRMLEKIEELLLKEKPEYVLVYGDTNSTLAGALAAKKLHIRVVHVEAGLRSFNMRMPEEVNRILTDRISDILCCPTDTAVKNLRDEGFPAAEDADRPAGAGGHQPVVVNTGDVMLDAALYYSSFSADRSTIIREMGLETGAYVLCTIHRAENTDNPEHLKSIFEALAEIGCDMPLVLPLHPRTHRYLADLNLNHPQLDDAPPAGRYPATRSQRLKIIAPVGYFDMIELLKKCRFVMTDSGGLQKEAYFFGRPCITLRDETEWVELVECGANVLAGADRERIVSAYHSMNSRRMEYPTDMYGKGQAGSLIVKLLADHEWMS